MQKRRFVRIAIAVVLVLSCHQTAQCQDALTPAAIEPYTGDLSRPADVLLAEAEAQVARAALGRRLTEYMEFGWHLNELRAAKFDETQGPAAVEADQTYIAAQISRFERGLKQTESEIRELSRMLDNTWLLPVQTGIDDQQGAAALKNAQVLVTIGSKSGDVLEPTFLTLTAPGVSPVRFVQISPRVYLASGLFAGEYQLAWQLTPKSVVQRVPKITIPEQGCVVCEVKLKMPGPTCTTKPVDAIVLPHRATTRPLYGLPETEPASGITLPFSFEPPGKVFQRHPTDSLEQLKP